MPDTIEVRMSHPWQDHEIGDVVTVDAAQARQLITAGVAVVADDTAEVDAPEVDAPEVDAPESGAEAGEQPRPRRRG